MFDEKVCGRVVLLPDGEDPDSILRKGNDLEDLLVKAIPSSVYLSTTNKLSRKMIYNSLLTRGPLDTVEFLSYVGNQEELKAYEELSFKRLFQELGKDARVVLRKDSIEVRKFNRFLLLFSKENILLWEREGKEYRKQAEEMFKRLIDLNKRPLKGKN